LSQRLLLTSDHEKLSQSTNKYKKILVRKIYFSYLNHTTSRHFGAVFKRGCATAIAVIRSAILLKVFQLLVLAMAND
jgi:hypothetical protein